MAIGFNHKALMGLKKVGEYTDPDTGKGQAGVRGLKLRVTASKTGGPVAKSWAYRYQVPGGTTRTYIGLGSFPEVGIAEAREKARGCAESVRKGVDPKDQRAKDEQEATERNASKRVFKDVAHDYWLIHKGSWKNLKHQAQWWDSWMQTYTLPHIGKLPASDIRLDHIVTVLKPIWHKLPDTARKVRGAIGAVLEFAVAHRLRSEDINNPCKQLSQLEARLGKHRDQSEHQPGLDYRQVQDFYSTMHTCSASAHQSISYLALEFALLSGLRANCVATLRFDEVDATKRTALIPAEKMKTSKAFALPMTDRLLGIVEERRNVTDGTGYVFGVRRGKDGKEDANKPLSSGAMLEAIKTICGVKGITSTDPNYKPKFVDPVSGRRITVHGFRSCLVSWAEDHGYPRDLCESVIQHSKGDSNLQAYARGQQFDLRRGLLEAYDTFVRTTDKS